MAEYMQSMSEGSGSGFYSMEDDKTRWATHWMPVKKPSPPIKEEVEGVIKKWNG